MKRKNRIERELRYSREGILIDAINNINHLISRGYLDGKVIIIFGANVYAEHIISRLDKANYQVTCIVDNDERKHGKKQNGINICFPGELKINEKDACFLIVSSYFDEMAKQLEGMGYNRNDHVIKLAEVRRNRNYLSHRTFIRNEFEFFKLFVRVSYYRRLRYTRKQIFLAPVLGLGDYYYIFGYLHSYCINNNIDDYEILCLTDSGMIIGEMFGFKSIRCISKEVMDDLVRFANVLGEDSVHIKILHWAKRKGDLLTDIHKYSDAFDVPFNLLYRYTIYGDKASFCYPVEGKENKTAIMLFKELNLKKNKTIVISPDSNTVVNLPQLFWNRLVTEAKKLGFDLVTNLASKEEKPIDGTIGVFIPLEAVTSFCDSCGYFIGSRSGLCDLICHGTCKKIILYNDSFRLKNIETVFSFSRMGIGNNIDEIRYINPEQERVLEEIIVKLVA